MKNPSRREASLILTMLSLVFFYSCNKSDGPQPGQPSPSITIASVNNATQGRALKDGDMVNVFDTIKFDVNITAPGGFNVFRAKGGTTLEITRKDLGLAAGVTSAMIPFKVEVPESAAGGTLSLTFQAVDENDSSSSVEVKFPVGKAVKIFTAVLLGGQNNASVGSFYNALENKVLKFREAATNSKNVDFLYFYGKVNQATIAATDDEQAAVAFGSGRTSLANIPTKNSTKFKTIDATVTEFDKVKGEDHLKRFYISDISASASNVNKLNEDDVFGFQLASDRSNLLGIAKVTALSGRLGGANRSITLEVKVAGSAAN